MFDKECKKGSLEKLTHTVDIESKANRGANKWMNKNHIFCCLLLCYQDWIATPAWFCCSQCVIHALDCLFCWPPYILLSYNYHKVGSQNSFWEQQRKESGEPWSPISWKSREYIKRGFKMTYEKVLTEMFNISILIIFKCSIFWFLLLFT